MGNNFIRLDEINFPSAIRTVLKNLWVVILLCISAFLIAVSVVRLTYVPRFTSTTTLMVGARDSTNAYNSLTTTQSMASVFMEVFQSNVLRDKVSEQMPDGTFDGAVSTAVIPQTNLLVVSVTSSSPDKAFRQLNLILEHYESISEYLFENAQLEVIRDPNVPISPSNPMDTERIYTLAVLLAGVAGVILIVLLWFLRDTVQTTKAARRKLDARLLRTIGHEPKKSRRSRGKNAAPLIKNPLISLDFLEDNLSLASSVDYHMRRHGQKVILVTSVGENEGKSTVAANLAIALGEKGRKVLLLDTDFRKPSQHKIFDQQKSAENYAASLALGAGSDPSEHLIRSERYGITLGLTRANHKSISRLLNSGILPAFLQKMRGEMDYIILDTPPMLAAADAEILARLADTAVLVVRSDFMPAASINQGLDRLRAAVPDLCGIVLNNHLDKLFYR